MANKVPMPTMYHCQAPKKMNEKMTAKITNEQSTQIFTFGNSIPVIRLTATGKPSPGMVTESKAAHAATKMIQTVLFLSYLSLLNSMQKYKKIGTYANSYTF